MYSYTISTMPVEETACQTIAMFEVVGSFVGAMAPWTHVTGGVLDPRPCVDA